uniref:Trigger factor C-terminal domain-containing protein n=1 Tax=Fagus sylvatica TaxID=28930 RepID=A0A2N9GYB3_FAGSY
MEQTYSSLNSLRYDVIVDVAPQVKWIPENGYKNLKIVVEIDSDIDASRASEQELRRRHKSLGSMRIVTDRGLQIGDVAVLDISATTMGQDESNVQKIPSAETKGLPVSTENYTSVSFYFSFVMHHEHFLPQLYVLRAGFHFDTEDGDKVISGFLDSIIGIQRGETKSFELVFPESWKQENLRGVHAQFTVECKELFYRDLPELDDSLADRLLTGCTTLKQVKESLFQRCLEVEQTAREQATDNVILDQLQKMVEADIPQSLFEEQGRQLYGAKLLQIQASMKLNEQQLASLSSPKAVNEYLENQKDNILNVIKQNLAVGDIYKRENLQFSTDELVKEVENSIAEFKREKQEYDEERVREQVQEILEGAKGEKESCNYHQNEKQSHGHPQTLKNTPSPSPLQPGTSTLLHHNLTNKTQYSQQSLKPFSTPKPNHSTLLSKSSSLPSHPNISSTSSTTTHILSLHTLSSLSSTGSLPIPPSATPFIPIAPWPTSSAPTTCSLKLSPSSTSLSLGKARTRRAQSLIPLSKPECFRLVRKRNFGVPFRGCGYLLDKMANLKPAESAWGFYMEVLDCGYPPNVRNFNVLMHKLCKEGKIVDAQMVFDEMGKWGLLPTIVSFNTLINGYCKSGDLKEGFRLKSVIKESGMRPDVFTYSVLINGLCKESRLDDANRLFDEMCDRGLVANDVIFTTLIDGQCKNGRIDLALEIYQQMLKKGVKPDLITYNTLINGLCKIGDLKEVRNLVDEMSTRGLKPDKITYTTLIDGYCKEGDLESALKIRKKMNEEGIKLDNVAFTALISGLCREGRVVDAERTMREMLNAGMKPDDATYTMVMDGFCKKGDVKMGFKLLKEMQTDGHVPDDITYNILLEGHCKNGNPNHFDKLRNDKAPPVKWLLENGYKNLRKLAPT